MQEGMGSGIPKPVRWPLSPLPPNHPKDVKEGLGRRLVGDTLAKQASGPESQSQWPSKKAEWWTSVTSAWVKVWT